MNKIHNDSCAVPTGLRSLRLGLCGLKQVSRAGDAGAAVSPDTESHTGGALGHAVDNGEP